MSDIDKIKKLRQSTGAGFKDCNSALKESNGDLDKAVEILRIKGIAKASKKMLEIANQHNIELAIMMDVSAACGNHVIYDGNRYAENKHKSPTVF